ncbi:hypothetical protein AGMMS50239_26870 [Bacteroidia bacterium]|nr:hypothetical protein AGMMS50239_26870 [Bacteroidia bacterium]GHV31780.1 hypothetical protein FACS1894177_06990 [Bacteroidia bacterium]
MNIIFLTRLDPKDINSWSGTMYYIYNKLKEKHHIEIIGLELLGQLDLFVKGNFADTFIPADRYVENLNRLLSERINTLNFDLIFFGDLLFFPVEANTPFIFFSDLTYEQVKIYYCSIVWGRYPQKSGYLTGNIHYLKSDYAATFALFSCKVSKVSSCSNIIGVISDK